MIMNNCIVDIWLYLGRFFRIRVACDSAAAAVKQRTVTLQRPAAHEASAGPESKTATRCSRRARQQATAPTVTTSHGALTLTSKTAPAALAQRSLKGIPPPRSAPDSGGGTAWLDAPSQ